MSSSVDTIEELIFHTNVHRKDVLAQFTTNFPVFIFEKF